MEPMEVEQQRQGPMLKVGDEVCRLIEHELVFGTLEHLKEDGGQEDKRIWKVKWIHDPSLSLNPEANESELMVTDRAVYKGSRVRLGDKLGVCRAVLHKADVRILGTNSIIPDVNIEEFRHLKEFTQKSVVHYNGWLGIVLSTDRNVTLQHSDDTTSSHNLNTVLPTGPLQLETHWINEQVDNFSRGLPPSSKNNSNDNNNAANNQQGFNSTMGKGVRAPDVKKSRRIALVKDLSVECVTVKWEHQIDHNSPDKPKQKFTSGSHSQLQLIKESVAIDDSSFSFEVGNLGRMNVKKRQSDFVRWDGWQRNFAKQYLPSMMSSDELRSGVDYDKAGGALYCRVYDSNASLLSGGGAVVVEQQQGEGEGDEDKENALKMQTKQEPVLGVDGVVVVEIAHIYTIPDILWQDATSDLPRSIDLEVLEATILSDTELPRPGDFITCKHLPQHPVDKTYMVVLRSEISSSGGKTQLVVRVLDSTAGKVIVDQTTIVGDDLRLSAKFVERHPVFQYFNETSTIVVVNEDGPDGVKIRIGNVVGTNLQGKVCVRFLEPESATGYRDDWVWPQVCAIYSTKGFDLECVKSHVTDTSDEQERKVHRIIEMLESRVDVIWKNTSKTEQDLTNSLNEFKFLFNTLSSIYSRGAGGNQEVMQQDAYLALTTYLALPIGVLDGGRPPYFKGNNELAQLVGAAVCQLITQAKNLLPPDINPMASSSSSSISSSIEMVDLTNQTCCQSPPSPPDPLGEIFSETVAILEHHPGSHHYAKTTSYNPVHSMVFIKSVREELVGLHKICSTETKSKIGILSRTYSDRMDLLSFLIRGPEDTPYENGLFLFDAALPSNYPNVPPQFHFHAFKAGRLNPNLYAEGKVCISLLGTWSGRDEREKWTKDSNIVQILISIQGLILVVEPYHNEPGYERENFTAANAEIECRKYNTELMPLVVQMMINQIQHGMEPFTQQIEQFYRLQVPIFLERWRNWLQGVGSPPFALTPMDSTFKAVMIKILNDLEAIWQKKLVN